jgi:hypothetical protein
MLWVCEALGGREWLGVPGRGASSPGLEVFAIERDTQAWQHVDTNVQTFALATCMPYWERHLRCSLACLTHMRYLLVAAVGPRWLLPATVARLYHGGRPVMNCITLEPLHRGLVTAPGAALTR